jgi:hypothetical protein
MPKIMENNTPTQPNYYGVLPAPVRYSKELSASEKLLYAEISALSNVAGFCWAGNEYFAELYSVTSTQVSRWVSGLNKAGFVRIETVYLPEKNKNQRRLYLDFSTKKDEQQHNTSSQLAEKRNHTNLRKSATPSCAKAQPPLAEKRKHNSNISNTNTDNTLAPKGAINPAPQKKPEEDYSEFAAYCQQHGFEHVPKISRLLTKEKVAQKRKEQSELAFYETVAAIDAYLKSVAPKMPYKDLNLVWKQFAFSNGCAYTKKAHNSLYSSVYGKAKESHTKSDIEALGAIWCVLEANTKTSDGTKASFEQVCASVDVFFGKFPPSRRNDTDLKLAFIRTDVEAIIREIRGQAVQRTSAQAKGGTVVTKELLSNVAEMYRKEEAEKEAQEQAMRAAGLI